MTNCVENKTPCTGCGVCQAICPVKAIHLELNQEGFWTAILDKTKCVDCQKCLSVCPKFTDRFPPSPAFDTLPLYAAYSREEQMSSSSGGIAAEITKWAFANGYKVAGVRYNYQRQCAETIIADNLEQAQAFKGSKYLQSDSSSAFEQILTWTDKLVVFGTPCQIAALHLAASLVNRRKDLILVDFFCHGVPSYLLWKAFVAQQPEEIKQINFRNKKRGWHTFTMEINRKIVKNNPFYDLFFSDLLLGPQCYCCESRKSFAFADIRLGDFWGSLFDLREDGISVVCCCSPSGEEMLSSLRKNIQFIVLSGDHSLCKRSQASFKSTTYNPRERSLYLELLQQKISLQQLLKRNRYPHKILIFYFKKLLFLSPRIAGLIRFCYHKMKGY